MSKRKSELLVRDELAFRMLCAFNNIDPKQNPPGPDYQWFHNKWMREAWERVAKVATQYVRQNP